MFRDVSPNCGSRNIGGGRRPRCPQELGGPVEVSDDSQPPKQTGSLRKRVALRNENAEKDKGDADQDNDASQGTMEAIASSRPSRYDGRGLMEHREEVKGKRAMAKAGVCAIVQSQDTLAKKLAEARKVAREADETFDMRQHDPKDGRQSFLQPPRDKTKSFHEGLSDSQRATMVDWQEKFNAEMDEKDARRQTRDREVAERVQAELNGDTEKLKKMDFDDKKRSASPDPDEESPPRVAKGASALMQKWDQRNLAAEQDEANAKREARRRAATHIAAVDMEIGQKVANRKD